MKRTRSLLICLAGALAWHAAARADDAVLPGNPYAPVVTRNIFGLNPPPKVDPNAAADATPPPKITPNGITDILGQLQVLFKVASPAKAGKPAGDDDYILSEGERQDDIEVIKIDEKAGVVTFNNHGETQELPLIAATSTASVPPARSTGSLVNPAAGFRPPPGGLPGPAGNVFNGRGGGAYGGNNSGGAGIGNNGMNAGGSGGGYGGNNPGGLGNNGLNIGNPSAPSSSTYNAASQIPPGMTPEQQVLMIEANRLNAQQQGDTEGAAILPITEMTPGASP